MVQKWAGRAGFGALYDVEKVSHLSVPVTATVPRSPQPARCARSYLRSSGMLRSIDFNSYRNLALQTPGRDPRVGGLAFTLLTAIVPL